MRSHPCEPAANLDVQRTVTRTNAESRVDWRRFTSAVRQVIIVLTMNGPNPIVGHLQKFTPRCTDRNLKRGWLYCDGD
jgi:hypothetical protein